MNRVTKFRAWDASRKKMHTSPKWVEFKFDGEGKLKAVNYHLNGSEQILPVMQFTGLHDVNGVEICEGDIVTVPGIGNAVISICPLYGVCYVKNGNEIPYIDCAAELDYPTIISNIHQKPELLKE